MLNNSIALNPKLQALSSADYNKSPKKLLSNLIDVINDVIRPAKVETEERQEKEQFQEKQELSEMIKGYYSFRIKLLDNLKLAFAILAEEKSQIELTPNYDLEIFLDAISNILSPVEIFLLSDRVYKLLKDSTEKINTMKSCDDVTISDMQDMETENQLLTELSCGLIELIASQIDDEDLEAIEQTLKI